MSEDLALPLRSAPKARPTTGLLSDDAARLIQARIDGEWLHPVHDLERDDEHQAREWSGIPAWERVIAIAGNKAFGGLKRGLALGRAGLYHEHDPERERFGFQSWEHVAAHGADSSTDTFHKNHCRVGAVIYDLTIPADQQRALCDLVNEICDLIDPPTIGRAPIPEPRQLPRPSTLTDVAAAFADDASTYVSPDIPRRKERNARKTTDIPDAEEMTVLIDLTVLGSAKNALVLSESGLYYNDSAHTDVPRHIAWSVVAGTKITTSKSRIDVGGTTLSLIVDAERVADLLHLMAAFCTESRYLARQLPQQIRDDGQGTMTRAASADELAASVWRITSGRKGFLVAPDIPEIEEQFAREAVQVPETEQVIALLCNKYDGSAEDLSYTVLTAAGIYYRDSKEEPPVFESWHDVSLNGVEKIDLHMAGSNSGYPVRFVVTGSLRIFIGYQRASWKDVASVVAFTARRATGT